MMYIEIVTSEGYKCYQASNIAANRMIRSYQFERGCTIAIGREGIELVSSSATIRVVFRNKDQRLGFVERTSVRSEIGRKAIEKALAHFPAVAR